MDNDLVSAVATAIKNKRLELINQPLARIYNDLALAAISVLATKAIEPDDCVAAQNDYERRIREPLVAAAPTETGR